MTEVAAGPGGASHAMLLYHDLASHAAACSEYISNGLASGAAVLAAATRPHADSFRARLPAGGDQARFDDLTSEGADPGRVLSVIRAFAREHVGQSLRFLLDVGWLGRPPEHLAEAIRYDALMRTALPGAGTDVLCCYDKRLGADLLAAAEQAHPVIMDADSQRVIRTTSDGMPELQVAGTLSAPPDHVSRLTFRSDQAAVRRFAADYARQAGLPQRRVTDFVIAVGELASNTLRHTSGTGTLTLWTDAGEIICQVSDTGQITDPLAGTLRPAPAETGSRGLWLVHQVSDLVQVRSGPAGSTIRIHMRLPDGRRPTLPSAERRQRKASDQTA